MKQLKKTEGQRFNSLVINSLRMEEHLPSAHKLSKPSIRFTIVIPTYNRRRQLSRCLAAVADLDYPHDKFEVIVVDDGGRVSLEGVIRDNEGKMVLKLIRQAQAGPAKARNTGANEGTGDYLAFIDDDCTPARNWLRRIATQIAESPRAAIGGQTINVLDDNLYSVASQFLVGYLYEYYEFNNVENRFFTSNNLVFPKRSFDTVNGFDSSFKLAAAEDRHICYRWLREGRDLVYAPSAQVHHFHDLSFSAFCRQHYRYGRGGYNYHRRRVSEYRDPLKTEPSSFYFRLLSYPFKHLNRLHACKVSFLLVLSQTFNAIGFSSELIRSKLRGLRV